MHVHKRCFKMAAKGGVIRDSAISVTAEEGVRDVTEMAL